MRLRATLAVICWLAVLVMMLAALGFARRNGTGTPEDIPYILGLMGFATAGALIVVRRPDNLIGWIFCADVVFNALAALAHDAADFALVTQPGALPGADWMVWLSVWIGDSAWLLLLTFTFLLFPTGQLPSRRWRPLAWLILTMLALHTFVLMFKPGPFDDWPVVNNPLPGPVPAWLVDLDNWLDAVIALPILGSMASLVFRYRAASGEERQQIKWIALVAALMCIVVVIGTVNLALGRNEAAAAAFDVTFPLVILVFPITVGISILRHRLWDIDVLIRRTLVYSVLTALLALAYFVSVLMLQPPLARLTGQGNQLATVLSTLFVAGLFVPLRGRVQRAIDRRFYRGKIDAAQTLAAFSAAARDEVDLDHITRALLDSVGRSFQPEYVSLWVPPAERGNGGGVAARSS